MDDMEAVEEFLREMSAPPRRRPVPRIAEPLRGLDIEEVQGPQGKIAAWRIGEGPAVLLVHGYEDDNALCEHNRGPQSTCGADFFDTLGSSRYKEKIVALIKLEG